ncbi:GNAT family N-acetyltransferase [Anianabacter salinae]|uniref:GNAT family N-acetyltransferase n=1 Tax=Anianabacter salinae TaxID=2851023 RepID=UPI00225E17C6|nr:GNAT family N-acetyltransferase [Anianabacter salinae]MBV0912833.1 GNAT family N-acetyltransferase [Anianabacter salinae]
MTDFAAGALPDILLRDLETGDAGWLIQRHAELYARDEGFDQSFEALVAEILADFIRNRRPQERAWIAVRDGQRLGSVFCVRQDDETAKLRLFLLEPEARGQGLGRRLLEACIDHARAQGFRKLVLWTHASHRAACALYAARGFVLTASTAKVSFGVPVVEQSWELAL